MGDERKPKGRRNGRAKKTRWWWIGIGKKAAMVGDRDGLAKMIRR
jgi:hypothetical protein